LASKEERKMANKQRRSSGPVALGLAICAGFMATAASPGHAEAQNQCKQVHGRVVATVTTENCPSPSLLCTAGTITGGGPLNGATTFTALALAPGAGLSPVVPPTTLSYTGDFTITTKRGQLVLRDVGIADFVAAAFTEIDTITAGTGSFAGSTGTWFISGEITGGGTGFDADISGTICGGS
jgi:hypothetical protein